MFLLVLYYITYVLEYNYSEINVNNQIWLNVT